MQHISTFTQMGPGQRDLLITRIQAGMTMKVPHICLRGIMCPAHQYMALGDSEVMIRPHLMFASQ